MSFRRRRTLVLSALALFLVPAVLLGQATHITTGAATPATCTVGDLYYQTGAPAGLYSCTATNTWTLAVPLPTTGSGNYVLAGSPTLTTPNLGTPSAATLTNATGLPISTGVSGLGAGVATFLGTPSVANFTTALGTTGTASSTTYLRGDNSWAPPSAGAWTQIGQVVVNSTVSTVTFSSIPSTYSQLVVAISSRDVAAVNTADSFSMQFNGDSTSSHYNATLRIGAQSNATFATTAAASSAGQQCGYSASGSDNPEMGQTTIWINNYSNAVQHKTWFSNSYVFSSSASIIGSFAGSWEIATAINQLVFTTVGSGFGSGSVFTLYGVQ